MNKGLVEKATSAIILILIFIPVIELSSISIEIGDASIVKLDYIGHAPIIISSNDDLEAQGWSGLGTEEEPYIIQGLNITAETCISISHTSAYLVIRDCVLKPTRTSYPEGSGVNLYNLSHVTVESCSFVVEMCSGITIDQSENCSICGNSMNVSKEGQGVYIHDSSFCEISNNKMQTKGWAISIKFSSDLLVCNNTIFGTPIGIRTSYSWNGIASVDSSNISIHENNIQNGGFFLSGGVDDCVISFQNNSVNSKPVAYLANRKVGEIDGSQYGQVIVANCTSVHVLGGTFEQTTIGIQLDWCTDCIIEQVEAVSTAEGTSFLFCQNCTVRESVYVNTISGIKFQGSDNCSIIDVRVSHSSYGLDLADSSMCNVTSGVVFCNDYGIRLENENSEILGNDRFWNNSIGWNVHNARDDVSSTLWDDGIAQGNYWSDFQGENEYQVPGEGNNTDRFPSQLIDTIPPQIDSPSDIEYEEGCTTRIATWNPNDEYPCRYDIYQNGILIDTNYWIGTSIAFDVGGCSAGVYNITIVVCDGAGNFVFDTIRVNSRGNQSSTTFIHGLIDTETILFIGCAIAIVIVIFFVKRKSK